MKKKILIGIGILIIIIAGNYFASINKGTQTKNDIDLHSHGDGGLHSH